MGPSCPVAAEKYVAIVRRADRAAHRRRDPGVPDGLRGERPALVVALALGAQDHLLGHSLAVAREEADGVGAPDLDAAAHDLVAVERGDRVALDLGGPGVDGRALLHRADRVRDAVD